MMTAPDKKHRSKSSRAVWSAIIFGIVGLVAFGTVELAARAVFFPEWNGLLPRSTGKNPYFGLFNIPNLNIRRFSPANYDVVNTTNSFGFRDRQVGFEEDLKGTWIFGDSNTFAMGLNDEDAYTAMLDAKNLPTANMAGLGSNVPRDLRIMDKMAELGGRPKQVLLALSMNFVPFDPNPVSPNEITGIVKVGPFNEFQEKLINATRPESFLFRSIKTILLRNVALYGFIKSKMVSVPALRDWLRDRGLVQDIDIQSRGPAWMKDKARRADVEAAAADQADQISTLKEKAQKEFGSRFAVVLLPDYHHLYPSRFAKYLAYFKLAPETQDAAQPYDALKAALQARGIFVIDVLGPLRATNDPQLIFYNDSHYDRHGHVIFAQTIADWITSGGSD